MLDDVSGFWWENITGPHMLVREMANCLADGKSVILRLDRDLAWQEQICDFVRHQLNAAEFRNLPWSGTVARDGVIPRLLQDIRQREAASCPGDYAAQRDYLRKERILANVVIWIVPDSDADLDTLIRFISGYRGKRLDQDGAFVLELTGSTPLPHLSDCVRELCYDKFIRPSDVLLFSSILAEGEPKIPDYLKTYAAHVVAGLSQGNVELIPQMLQSIDLEREDPGAAVARLWREGLIPCPDLLPDAEELNQQVWRAQLQTAFAGIETERLRIAEDHAEQIEQAIATEYWDPLRGRTGYINQHGEEPASAADVEFGTLKRMMALWVNGDRERKLLCFSETGLRDHIIFLTECRNSLAHHRPCTPEDMCKLLLLLHTNGQQASRPATLAV